MRLDEYQQRAILTDQIDVDSPESKLVPLLGLAGEVGSLLVEYKKFIRDADSHRFFNDEMQEELGDILWYTANLATKFGFSLSDIATKNIDKVTNRWPVPGDETSILSLDANYPKSERLPTEYLAEFSVQPGDRKLVTVTLNGEKLGDSLTDNSYKDDGYGFHDVFHLANAALLGWSPIVRRLLARKRKSNPLVDEVEDGGRAAVIEEGLSAFVFNYAVRHNYLDGVRFLDFSLLKTIQQMVSELEVSIRTLAQWESGIFKAYAAWRSLRENNGGTIHADFNKQTFEVV